MTTSLPEGLARLAADLWCRLGKPNLPSMVDATLLDPTRPPADSASLVEEASRLGAYCALVPPSHVADDVVRGFAERLGVRLCSVAGFPYGYQPVEVKAGEVSRLASLGVEEVDYVIDVSRAVAGDLDYLEREVREAARAAAEAGVRLKLIVEAPVVSDDVLEYLVGVAADAGVYMVKTSTGVIAKGGDPLTVSRLHAIASRRGLPVKAAGGIRTALDALLAVAAGASRIGASAYRRIIEEYGYIVRVAGCEGSPADG